MASSSKKRSVSTPVATSTAAAQPVRNSNRSATVEFNPDYTYVKKDLARIGIMAGSFIVVLVVISFFLR